MGAGSGVNKTQLDALITSELAELDATRRQALWTQILTAVNADAAFAPLTYMTSRAVVRPGVFGFAFGAQQVSPARTLA
jgi:ABC-type transport system substrate-binding protein